MPTTSLQRPLFLADIPYNDSCFNISTKATYLADRPYIDSCLNLSTTVPFLADSPHIDSCFNLSTTAIFLVDSPYIDSCFNLSTKATLFCPQGGCCGEVELHNRKPQDSRTRTTTSTRFDFKFFAYSQKINSPESFVVFLSPEKISTVIFIAGG